jgi:hypothetical protein
MTMTTCGTRDHATTIPSARRKISAKHAMRRQCTDLICSNMPHPNVLTCTIKRLLAMTSHTHESLEEASEGVIYSWELRCRV